MRLISLITALLIFQFSGIAQEPDDDYYFRRKQRQKKAIVEVDLTEVIKFTPTQMLTGELLFGYERKMSDKASWEVQLGPTISEIKGIDYNSHYFSDFYGGGYQRESRFGYSVSASLRYYPSDHYEALQGFYVAPVIKYRRYNYLYEPFDSSMDSELGNKGQLMFTFNFGKQVWLSKTFSLDYYGGLGMGMQHERFLSYESFQSGYDSYGYPIYEYKWVKGYDDTPRYFVTMGLKVGIGR